MNATIFFLLIITWVIIAIFDYVEFCWIWQLKEYRLGRFIDFLKSKNGRAFLKSYVVVMRLVAGLILAMVWLFDSKIFSVVVVAFIIFEVVRIFLKIAKRRIKRPVITVKALLIIFSAIIVEGLLWFVSAPVVLLVGFVGLRLLTLSLIVAIFYVPTTIFKKIYIWRATEKLKKYSSLKIIGITGSYGKTTVKNFLAQILKKEFKVVSTPKNINTEIGVAKFILATDFSDREIFIVEMGAYAMGEIKLICDMVNPSVGILTAINEQHLSLFGSIANIQKTKYELLRSLPEDGLAITNSDNQYCREFLDQLTCRVETFGNDKKYKPQCLVENMQTNEKGIIGFEITLNNEKYSLYSNIIGEHNAFNIAACVLVARELGMDMQATAEQIKNLSLPEGTLRTFNYGKSVIIDDSYNANPDGFLAALDVLGKCSQEYKKIVITRGMIELGEESIQLHKKVGEKIAKTADELVMISKDNENHIKKGIGDRNIDIHSMYTPDELLQHVKILKGQKAVILLENRIPESVLRELVDKKTI